VHGDAAESDRIGDTVDYRRLAALVRVFAGQERLLLEGLAVLWRTGSSSGFRRSSARASVMRKPDVVLDHHYRLRGGGRRRTRVTLRVRQDRREPWTARGPARPSSSSGR
jgi:hypothetical protein